VVDYGAAAEVQERVRRYGRDDCAQEFGRKVICDNVAAAELRSMDWPRGAVAMPNIFRSPL